MKKYYKQILVKIETVTQYDSIRQILIEFKKQKINFDIYIPEHKENTRNVNEMYNKTHNRSRTDGFTNIIRKVLPTNRYHLALLAPHYEEGINAKYYIKYSYGSSHSLKPSLTHHTAMLNHYHGYLVYNDRDAEIFSAFCKTYILPDLKHIGYRHARKTNDNKKTILILPSWEDQNTLEWIISASHELKKNYKIVVKLHPFGDFGTEVSKHAENTKIKIQDVVDAYHDENANLSELLADSDLVISDISGSVFDALYTNVPVIIYSKDIHRFDTTGIKSAVAKYADEGYIFVARSVHELIQMAPQALLDSYALKQRTLAEKIFQRDLVASSAIKKWMKVVTTYLTDDINQEYISLHDIMTEEFWYYKNLAESLENEIKNYKNRINALSSELNSFLGIKRSFRLLGGNIKRKVGKSAKRYSR